VFGGNNGAIMQCRHASHRQEDLKSIDRVAWDSGTVTVNCGAGEGESGGGRASRVWVRERG
jgi:hypothetical protein